MSEPYTLDELPGVIDMLCMAVLAARHQAAESPDEGAVIHMTADCAERLLATLKALQADAERDNAMLEHAFSENIRNKYHEDHGHLAESDCPLCCMICARLGYPVQD